MKISIATFLLMIFLVLSCKTNEPSYTFNKHKGKQLPDSAMVVGAVKNENGKVLSEAAIKVNEKHIYRADQSGQIRFNLSPGKYNFTGLWIHYKPSKTKEFELHAGDSVRLDFYLEQDISLHED